ncbi:hypothetical protein AMTR_s00086p00113050 [Amborella trichopoda]|uniref:Uncharacterized protein n=1 Tax=Amborella trichopoda TaxID=13333 RepID=W1P580_AMBTC|nr:hypothetical protein AMTR_s00086p00113050 [Amborella trichopoda]
MSVHLPQAAAASAHLPQAIVVSAHLPQVAAVNAHLPQAAAASAHLPQAAVASAHLPQEATTSVHLRLAAVCELPCRTCPLHVCTNRHACSNRRAHSGTLTQAVVCVLQAHSPQLSSATPLSSSITLLPLRTLLLHVLPHMPPLAGPYVCVMKSLLCLHPAQIPS